MENNFTIQKVRKQGRQKIVNVPTKDKSLEVGCYVLIRKLNESETTSIPQRTNVAPTLNNAQG